MARFPDVVFDASALICLIRQEPGWENVAKFGTNAGMSAVNLAEIVYRLRKYEMPVEMIDLCLRQTIGHIVPFDREQAYIAASIHAKTREQGLSIADCACLALGVIGNATVVTADRQWQALSLEIAIVQIR